MKVISLQAENFKRLRAVDITPAGHMVKITGANAQGKSSVLDAIWYAIAGKEAAPAQPVRQGAKATRVRVDLGDLVVERRQTADGAPALKVTNREGASFPSPQRMLDELWGRLAFDPLDFQRQDAKRQGETLRALLGLDFSHLDAQRQAAFSQRTEANRRVKELEAQEKGIQVPPGAPEVEESAAALLGQIGELEERNCTNQKARDDANAWQRTEREAKEKYDRLKAQALDAKAAWEAIRASTEERAEAAAKLIDEDVAPLRARLSGIEQSNAAARARRQRDQVRQQLDAAVQRASELAATIERVDADKAAALDAAKFPVAGLSLDEGVVTFNGVPLSQCSAAEQLRVSVAMAMALNPKLKVLRITDGSLLDRHSMAILEEMARVADYQVWLEVVDESGKVGIVIEDGAVAAVNVEPEVA